MVIWVIGMSGSGKTTLGKEMVKILRGLPDKKPWIFLDGDALRILTDESRYDVEGRAANAKKMTQLCSYLEGQGINVLACILSIFPEHQKWNRENFKQYRQLYIQVDLETLKRRDNKSLYSRGEKGEIDNVVGIHIPFPEPVLSDYVLDNNCDAADFRTLAIKSLHELGFSLHVGSANYPYTERNLLESPHKYEYTPFEGKSFLISYRQNREKAIASLNSKLNVFLKSNLRSTAEITPEIQSVAAYLLKLLPDSFEEKREFFTGWLAAELQLSNTPHLTRSFLIKQLLAEIQDSDAENRFETLKPLIQRFEVSKKIYRHYDLSNWKKMGEDFDLIDFMLFFILLLALVRHLPVQTSLIAYNAALKLGDILISCEQQILTPGSIFLSIIALSQELSLLKKDQYA